MMLKKTDFGLMFDEVHERIDKVESSSHKTLNMQ